jgi:hypothetical protein
VPELDEIWSCAFEVYPNRGHHAFGEYSGAFVNVFVIAGSPDECRQAAVASLAEDHFVVAGEESEPVRLSEIDWKNVQQDFSDEFERIRPDLLPISPVQYGSFHTFPKDGQDA